MEYGMKVRNCHKCFQVFIGRSWLYGELNETYAFLNEGERKRRKRKRKRRKAVGYSIGMLPKWE